jgi:chemotaxis protein CheD
MLYKIVDISDLKVSNDEDDVLVTYSLGSCIGLTLYDPEAGVGGLIHCMLPLSKIDKEKSIESPSMFVDTGVTAFLTDMFAKGAKKKNIIAKIAGGAKMLNHGDMFNIGERNYKVTKAILEKNGIVLSGEAVGGTVSRTVFLYMLSGETVIRSGGEEFEL